MKFWWNFSCYVFQWLGVRRKIHQNPRGPKDWKNSRFRSGIEIFKRPISDWIVNRDWKFQANHTARPLLWGIIKVGIEIFNRDWKFQAWIENFKRMDWESHAINRDWIFQSQGPLGFHVKNGVQNGKFHANFTLLGRSSWILLSATLAPLSCQEQLCLLVLQLWNAVEPQHLGLAMTGKWL